MPLKSKLVPFLFLFPSFGQVYARGLDLRPALLGCIMSGGDCLDDTGIPVVDWIFGRDNDNMDHYKTYKYKVFYYHSEQYWEFDHSPGPRECRAVKEQFYLEQTKWQPNPARDAGVQMNEHLKQYKQQRGANIFECTPKQRQMFIWAKIGPKGPKD